MDITCDDTFNCDIAPPAQTQTSGGTFMDRLAGGQNLVITILNWMIVLAVGILAIVLILSAIHLMASAAGEGHISVEKREKAKQEILTCLIGIALLGGIRLIVGLAVSIF